MKFPEEKKLTLKIEKLLNFNLILLDFFFVFLEMTISSVEIWATVVLVKSVYFMYTCLKKVECVQPQIKPQNSQHVCVFRGRSSILCLFRDFYVYYSNWFSMYQQILFSFITLHQMLCSFHLFDIVSFSFFAFVCFFFFILAKV